VLFRPEFMKRVVPHRGVHPGFVSQSDGNEAKSTQGSAGDVAGMNLLLFLIVTDSAPSNKYIKEVYPRVGYY